jgi:sugar/nucleoside kinase (ribokinase family)
MQRTMASRTSSGRIIGFGDPVLDVVSSVSFETLDNLDMQAGGCTAIPRSELKRLLSLPEINSGLVTVPGGSACNVCKCLAGLRANHEKGQDEEILFIGMVGNDPAAADFHSMLEASGVKPLLPQCDPEVEDASTASCLCLVSPDGQRTMRTYLGAAQKLTSAEQLPVEDSDLENVGLVHFEGYSLYKIGVAEATMRSARAAGSKISLDLASFEIVKSCWEALMSNLLKENLIDVLFCNEDEAAAACEAGRLVSDFENASPDQLVEAALRHFLQFVEVVVISRGKDGCLIGTADGQRASAAAENVTVVDTIGAGDYFSAGVLHAWISGAPLVACAACGCAAGAAAVQVAGAELGAEEMARLRNRVQDILDAANGDGNVTME